MLEIEEDGQRIAAWPYADIRRTDGADGSLLTVTFQDYMCPTAPEIPPLDVNHISTPSPNTVHGTKGLGDGSFGGVLRRVVEASV